MTNDELNAAVATGPMGWGLFDYSYMDDDGRVVCDSRRFRPATYALDTERVMDQLADDGCYVGIHRYPDKPVEVAIFKGLVKGSVSVDPNWKRAVCLAAIEAFESQESDRKDRA